MPIQQLVRNVVPTRARDNVRAIALTVCVVASACSSPRVDSGPSTTQLKEVEITFERHGNTDIERASFSYDGSGLMTAVQMAHDGKDAGHMEMTFSDHQLIVEHIAGRDDDERKVELAYDSDGRLQSRTFEGPESFVIKDDYVYSAGKNLPAVITSTLLEQSTPSETSTRSFEYDDRGRLASITQQNSPGDTADVRYDEAGRLDRIASYADGNVMGDYSFSYDGDDRLVFIQQGTREYWEIDYGDDGLISEIRHANHHRGELVTYRYAYGSGVAVGMALKPDIAYGELFDLEGHARTVPDVAARAPSEFARVLQLPTVEPLAQSNCLDRTLCEECLQTTSCEVLAECTSPGTCVDYYHCIDGCYSTYCEDQCRSMYPRGYYYYRQLFEFQDDYCEQC